MLLLVVGYDALTDNLLMVLVVPLAKKVLNLP